MSPLTKLVAAVAVSASTVAAFSGDMTWFHPGLGACGWNHDDGSPVVALNPNQYAGGSNCGRWITIQARGRTTAAQVVDLCPGCSDGEIDVAPVIFDDIASLDEGVVFVDWFFQ